MAFFCPGCGDQIDEAELVCKGCGALSGKVRDEILAVKENANYEYVPIGYKEREGVCPACGKMAEDEDNFCRYCGEKLK